MSSTPTTPRSGEWLDAWDPENEATWDKALAWKTLWITTFTLTMAFVAWFLPSAIVPKLNALGYTFSKEQLYWLAAIPGLSGGLMRIVWMILPPIMGTRRMVALTTALLVATVSPEPHFDKVRVWQRPAKDDAYRVPVAEVEDEIRKACRRWRVVEIIADPFRWTRTLQALEAEKLPVVEFPHSPARLTAATGDLYSAALNARMTHSGDRTLAEHVAAAIVVEDARGIRLSKASRSRQARKIDLAACLVMAHSRATWRATHRKKSKTRSFK